MAESQGNRTSDNRQRTASGAEVIFLVFLVAFGMGLGVWVERGFSFLYKEPTEQQFLGTPAIKEKQERLARLESAIKEAEKQLDVVELEKLRHTAVLQSLEKSEGAAPADVQTAKSQQLAANEYATLLNARINSLKKDAEQTAAALKPEKEAAERELTSKRRGYLALKIAVALVFPLLIVLVGLFAGGRLFNRVTKRRVWISQGSTPALLVLSALLVLLAYQAFEIAGAVLIGMILFLFVLRKINWSPKVE